LRGIRVLGGSGSGCQPHCVLPIPEKALLVGDLGSVQLPLEVSSGSMDDSEKVGLSPPTVWCPNFPPRVGLRVKLCQHHRNGWGGKGRDAPARGLTGSSVSDEPRLTCESLVDNAGSMDASEGCFLIPIIVRQRMHSLQQCVEGRRVVARPVGNPARDVTPRTPSPVPDPELPSISRSSQPLGAPRRGSPTLVSTSRLPDPSLRRRTRISSAPSDSPARLHVAYVPSACGRWRCGAAAAAVVVTLHLEDVDQGRQALNPCWPHPTTQSVVEHKSSDEAGRCSP